jgi:hypothetical protein
VRSLIEAERVEREREARIHAMEEEELRARREASMHPPEPPLRQAEPEPSTVGDAPEAGPGTFTRLEDVEEDRSPRHAEHPLPSANMDENTPILERSELKLVTPEIRSPSSTASPAREKTMPKPPPRTGRTMRRLSRRNG